ncbi:MAG TPA: outer membrane lipoprotein-sorting protein [Chthonomonadales bacterium]|nr:outer membrane lipoprotein-sorting protein [Chthonomonadales bacterium]
MTTQVACHLACAIILITSLWEHALASSEPPRLEQTCIKGLSDLQASVTVLKADYEELSKISRDLSLTYRLKELVMSYKEPNKLRFQNRIGLMIVNGSTRYVKFGGLEKKDDLGTATPMRYSLLDIGLITPSGLAAMRGKYLREETLEGKSVLVFEITYREEGHSRYIVWIDPQTRVVRKREWYNSEGKLRATFSYLDAREVSPGLWIPTRLEIRNSDGVVAGVAAYTELKVNQGLSDDIFEIS